MHRSGTFMESLFSRTGCGAYHFVGARRVRLGMLPPKSGMILEACLPRGVTACGRLGGRGGRERAACARIVSALMKRGVLISDSARAPLRLVFPAALARVWMLGCFREDSLGRYL